MLAILMYKEKLKTHKTYLNNHIKNGAFYKTRKTRIYFKSNLLKDQRTINATLQRQSRHSGAIVFSGTIIKKNSK